jgi:hypothetical protein
MLVAKKKGSRSSYEDDGFALVAWFVPRGFGECGRRVVERDLVGRKHWEVACPAVPPRGWRPGADGHSTVPETVPAAVQTVPLDHTRSSQKS